MWVVEYRTGGTWFWQWRRILGTFSETEAALHVADLERMGYKAVAKPYGYPLETEFEPKIPVGSH